MPWKEEWAPQEPEPVSFEAGVIWGLRSTFSSEVKFNVDSDFDDRHRRSRLVIKLILNV